MSQQFVKVDKVEVDSDKVKYSDDIIETTYEYSNTSVTSMGVRQENGKACIVMHCQPKALPVSFKTIRKPKKTGVLLVGWGGNNGSTLTAGIIANKNVMKWRTKEGYHQADYFGSVTQASTVRLGNDEAGNEIYVPMSSIVPMVDPNELVIGGWDISSMNLGDAMIRSKVLDVALQDQIYPIMKEFVPMPSIYYPDFIAANQADRADNVIPGKSKKEHLEILRKNIRDFKEKNSLDSCIILWTANTERFSEIQEGVNDTADNLLVSIEEDEEEIAPSTIFAVASILEGCSYINGSPQNTFVPGVIELAIKNKVFIGGDDFKSGQTKMKSVLVDFLVNSGIKPISIVSYNHLGNNDGKNLSAPKQFRSKEISKSNVVDDMVASNGILYNQGEHPDHVVVIKYVPAVGDSKRAMDEYTSSIFLGGKSTIVLHNTCEDSLLAAPLMLDLIILTELFQRVTLKVGNEVDYEGFHSILSLLSFLIKAPLTPSGTPVVNALFAQRESICNFLRALVGLQPENYMMLEHRLKSAGTNKNNNNISASSASSSRD